MIKTKVKIFKDSVHGYINVPEYYIKNIIDTNYFQRLRNIDQTGMRVLYPSAKHDRFSHSLGVFHLGQKAMEALRKGGYFIDNFNRYEVLFLTACLLHDIGHTPFSHSLEELILNNSLVSYDPNGQKVRNTPKKKIAEVLVESIYKYEYEFCVKNSIQPKKITKIHAAPHEMFGAFLIFEKFYNNLIYIEKSVNIFIDESALRDDICFIARMIMGIKYEEFSKDRQERNCFIELLNGDNFDVDKLDYIVRDTHMSGINNVSVDVERLLGSLCIVTKTKHLNKKLEKSNINNLTISKICNNQTGEFEIDGRFKGIIEVEKGAEIEIDRGSNIELFKGVEHEYAEVSYLKGDYAYFSVTTKLKQDGEWIEENESENYTDKIKFLGPPQHKKSFSLYFSEGKLVEPLKIKAKSALEIHTIESCKFKIKGPFFSKGSLKLFHLDTLKGTISEVEILGNTFEQDFTSNKEPSENGYNTYSIGFRKQAINVIANVLEARNYLYLWVYAHHKVIYYANFLIPVIAKQISACCGDTKRRGFPSWKLCYDNLNYLDDYYIWTAVKYINSYSKEFKFKKPYTDLAEQLFSRVYNKSLYKSLAEFELVFDSFTIEQRLNALKKLRSRTDTLKPFLGEKKMYTAGYVTSKTLNEINLCIRDEAKKSGTEVRFLKELLYVVTEFKQKKLDPNSVCLDMVDQILPISQINLLSSNYNVTQSIQDKYFYLYYKCDINENLAKETEESSSRYSKEVGIFKAAIKNFFLQ